MSVDRKNTLRIFPSNIKLWNENDFNKKTVYTVESINKQNVLKAVSNNSVSGLFKDVNINLKEYPYLNWDWMIMNKLKGNNEKTKKGDDFAAI
jgi:hypothetical protein